MTIRKGDKVMKKTKNYYEEIDTALKSYETFKPYHQFSVGWICNRIDWCYQYNHITEAQMESLVDRVMDVMEYAI